MLSILNALPSAWDHPYAFNDAWSDLFDPFLSAPLFSPSLAWLHATSSAPRVRRSFLRPVDNEELESCDNSCDCGQLTKPSESSQLLPWRNVFSTSGDTDTSLQDKGDHFELSLSNTGLLPESVSVQVQDDTLHISGESTTKSEEDGYISERWSSFSRHFPLPEGVDQARITASQDAQGLLTISLPKVQSPAKPELLQQQATPAASTDVKDSVPTIPQVTSKPVSPKSSSPVAAQVESKRNTNTNTSELAPSVADDWEQVETPSPTTASTETKAATTTAAEVAAEPTSVPSSSQESESKSEACKTNWACAPTSAASAAATTEDEEEESPLESLLNLFSPSPRSQTQLDVVERDDSWEVACDVPGVKPEDLKVEFHDGLLTVSGHRQSARDKATKQLQHVERSSGAFSRRIRLPKQLVDEDNITAVHENGELRLTIGKKPLQPIAQPRVIPISSKTSVATSASLSAQSSDTTSNTQALAKQVLSESGKLDPVLAGKVASYV